VRRISSVEIAGSGVEIAHPHIIHPDRLLDRGGLEFNILALLKGSELGARINATKTFNLVAVYG
jgi:hypothetical protein